MTQPAISLKNNNDRKKNLLMGGRPSEQKPPAKVNEWVSGKGREQKLARITVTMPRALHTRIKVSCVAKSQMMQDVLLELLEREFGPAGASDGLHLKP